MNYNSIEEFYNETLKKEKEEKHKQMIKRIRKKTYEKNREKVIERVKFNYHFKKNLKQGNPLTLGITYFE